MEGDSFDTHDGVCRGLDWACCPEVEVQVCIGTCLRSWGRRGSLYESELTAHISISFKPGFKPFVMPLCTGR